jgi:DNA polymerase III, delta subunit
MHHGYLVVGSAGERERFLATWLKSSGISPIGNADFLWIDTESFGIADARSLVARSLEKAFGEKRVFVISADRLTREAQNALLKTLEEPIPNTHFFILAREEKNFLPTLLSRLQVESVGGEGEVGVAEKFLQLSLKKRLDFAKNFESSLPEFLDSLLARLESTKAPIEALKQVFTLRKYASDVAVQPRLVIEHLALVL